MITVDTPQLAAYLSERVGRPVEVLAIEPLSDAPIKVTGGGDGGKLKTFGYGNTLLVRCRVGGEERGLVFQSVAANAFGHEYRADRAANVLHSYDSYGLLPRHVHPLDVGVVLGDGSLHSIQSAGEFFVVTQFVVGESYAHDLQRLRDGGPLSDHDLLRARSLAAYLADIHAVKGDDPARYRRHLRDVIGGGEGIAGLIDSYPADFALADADWFIAIEQACVAWRWRLKGRAERLSQIHGDFHPFNVLFELGSDSFHLLDRSRGGWGEPADDVTALAINYLFFSLQRTGSLAPPFDALWRTFWATYLEGSGDEEVLAAAPPFLAWRALVLAHPVWYRLDDEVRRALLHFAEGVLKTSRFDYERVGEFF